MATALSTGECGKGGPVQVPLWTAGLRRALRVPAVAVDGKILVVGAAEHALRRISVTP